jgi:hypothetical protein
MKLLISIIAYLLIAPTPVLFAKYENGKLYVNYQNGKFRTFTGNPGNWCTETNEEAGYFESISLDYLCNYNLENSMPYPFAELNVKI